MSTYTGGVYQPDPTLNPSGGNGTLTSYSPTNDPSGGSGGIGGSGITSGQLNTIGTGVGGLIGAYGQATGYGQVAQGLGAAASTIGQYNTASQGILAPSTSLVSNAPSVVSNANTLTAGGSTGVNTLTGVANGSTPLDISKYYDPSMAFAEQQGQQAIERSAAARGGVISGGTLKDISQYITGLASTNYNNAAQIALNEQQQRIAAGTGLETGAVNANNTVANLVNSGVSATQTGAQLNTSSGNLIGQAQAGIGAANGNASSASSSGMGDMMSTIGTVASIVAMF